jgi:hypothetical protein
MRYDTLFDIPGEASEREQDPEPSVRVAEGTLCLLR